MKFARVMLAAYGLSMGLALGADEAAVAYHDLRYEDDLSAWRENPKPDLWNPVKLIVLHGETNAWLTLGGQLRARGEHWENFAFGPGNDDTFLLGRLRLHADLRAAERVRVFVEGKSAVLTQRDLPGGKRATDEDRLDLQNAFVDLMGELGAVDLTLRGGRQELSFGKQRLVSPLDWANTRRTFDGVRGIASLGGGRVDAFWARLVTVRPDEFNDGDSGSDLYGWYATWAAKGLGATLDLYGLAADNDNATYGSASGDEERYTTGARIGGVCGASGFDYDVEGAYQYGDLGDADIEAWFVAGQVGWTAARAPWKPRAYVGYDYATGDDDPADGTLKTFSPLYPLGHAYLGYVDVVGRQNIADTSAGLSFKPCRFATVKVDGHWFARAERSDALYNASGGIVRAGDAGTSRDVGRELDLTVVSPLGPHTQVQLGYSRFWAGDFIEQSGAAEDIDFGYAQVTYTF